MNLPERFNAKEQSALGLIYCSSFQALIKIVNNNLADSSSSVREAPVVIEELNDDFIITKKWQQLFQIFHAFFSKTYNSYLLFVILFCLINIL